MVIQASFVCTGRRGVMRLWPVGPIGGTKAEPPSISMLLKAASVSSIGTSTIWPSPVRSRCSSAAVTAPVSGTPQGLSAIRLGTKDGPSSLATAVAQPDEHRKASGRDRWVTYEEYSMGALLLK